jgi:23S rRNA (guanine745-N1)-methyltransferase
MTPAPLACTVRGCGEPLTRESHAWRCTRGHSYDVSRSGYVNLLQPQDRKSAQAGDSRSAVEARVVLEAAGAGHAVIEHITGLVRRQLAGGGVVADLGSGTGLALASICAGSDAIGVGIDLSGAAVEYAARRRPGQTWVVANADRRLPLLDRSVDVVLSLHARRNPTEVARVLRGEGRFLAAVPAEDDLVELRAEMHGVAPARDRVAPLVAEHAPAFVLENTRRIADTRYFEGEALRSLLRATYRGARHRVAARIGELPGLTVTLATEICVFRPRI